MLNSVSGNFILHFLFNKGHKSQQLIAICSNARLSEGYCNIVLAKIDYLNFKTRNNFVINKPEIRQIACF